MWLIFFVEDFKKKIIVVLKHSKQNLQEKMRWVTALKSSKNFQKIKIQFILKRNDECDFGPMKVDSSSTQETFEIWFESA